MQLYVRIQEGLHAEGIRDESFVGHPVVQATLKIDTVVGELQRQWRVLAVHLPHGQDKLARRRILDVFVPSADLDDAVLLLRDFNAVDEEVRSFCVSEALTHVAYSGSTWGAQGNKFHEGSVASAGNTRVLSMIGCYIVVLYVQKRMC